MLDFIYLVEIMNDHHRGKCSAASAKADTSFEKLSTDLKRLVNENIEFQAWLFDTN